MSKKNKKNESLNTEKQRITESSDVVFAKSFKHYRSGKIYYAKDYGHDCWPIPVGKKKVA